MYMVSHPQRNIKELSVGVHKSVITMHRELEEKDQKFEIKLEYMKSLSPACVT